MLELHPILGLELTHQEPVPTLELAAMAVHTAAIRVTVAPTLDRALVTPTAPQLHMEPVQEELVMEEVVEEVL